MLSSTPRSRATCCGPTRGASTAERARTGQDLPRLAAASLEAIAAQEVEEPGCWSGVS